MMRQQSRFLLALVLLLVESTNGYVVRRPETSPTRTSPSVSRRPFALQRHMSASVSDSSSRSFVLSNEQIKPILEFGSSGNSQKKVVNAFGLWCAAVSVVTGPFWAAAMAAVKMLHEMNQDFDPERAIYDATGKVWSKTWLTMTNCFPTISGDVQSLKQGHGPCLYVANHASWMDIPLLCTVLDPVFKFIAKGELSKVPCIGQQLAGGDHILIDRDDRRSQLRTFKEGIQWLRQGVPIMAFPEGQRSPDGRLMDFKGGLFSMAIKAGVPIVPITISHAHAIMPGQALFPVQAGRGKVRVHVHEAIDTSGKSDQELAGLVRGAFLSQLPLDQHPVGEPAIVTANEAEEEEEPAVVEVVVVAKKEPAAAKVVNMS